MKAILHCHFSSLKNIPSEETAVKRVNKKSTSEQIVFCVWVNKLSRLLYSTVHQRGRTGSREFKKSSKWRDKHHKETNCTTSLNNIWRQWWKNHRMFHHKLHTVQYNTWPIFLLVIKYRNFYHSFILDWLILAELSAKNDLGKKRMLCIIISKNSVSSPNRFWNTTALTYETPKKSR